MLKIVKLSFTVCFLKMFFFFFALLQSTDFYGTSIYGPVYNQYA